MKALVKNVKDRSIRVGSFQRSDLEDMVEQMEEVDLVAAHKKIELSMYDEKDLLIEGEKTRMKQRENKI